MFAPIGFFCLMATVFIVYLGKSFQSRSSAVGLLAYPGVGLAELDCKPHSFRSCICHRSGSFTRSSSSFCQQSIVIFSQCGTGDEDAVCPASTSVEVRPPNKAATATIWVSLRVMRASIFCCSDSQSPGSHLLGQWVEMPAGGTVGDLPKPLINEKSAHPAAE
jgi:hypothetical protein